MNKKQILITILAGLVVVSVAFAADRIYQNIENYYEAVEPTITTDQLGGSIENSLVSFDGGIASQGNKVMNEYGIYYYNLNVDASTDHNATTTGTHTNSDPGAYATNTLVFWKNNTGQDVIVKDLTLDVYEKFSFESSVACSTTTADAVMSIWPYVSWTATSAAQTLIPSTTLSTSFISDDINSVISVNSFPGSAYSGYGTGTGNEKRPTTTDFLLQSNEYIVCSWFPEGATSSRSYEPDNGFTGGIRLKGFLYNRDSD